jgi:integrase
MLLQGAKMARRFDTVEARNRLPARASPHWQKLSTGRHIGFRKTAPGSEGTWLAQYYDAATQKQTRRSLGAFDDLPSHRRFDAAVKAANDWFAHVGAGGSFDTLNIGQACQQYVEHIRVSKGPNAAGDLEARFRRRVYADPLARVELPKLTSRHLTTWRSQLAAKAVIVDPHATAPRTRDRSASSLNRDMTALRAALNHAYAHGEVVADIPWRHALKRIKNADGRREIYLDKAQRRALVDAAAEDLSWFLRGLCVLPLRPGALAALTVGSFDRALVVLTIGKDKSGKDRRIGLPRNTASLLEQMAERKLPAAPLFARSNGGAWTKDAWKKPIKEAARTAQLPADVTAYTMRHSAITDLVVGGLDALTVAQLSGTSLAMIDKHYGHLRADRAVAALELLALD